VKSNPTPSHASLTSHQSAVLKTLSEQSQSLSAQELHGLLQKERAIGLATIYRSLETLKLQGLLQSRVGIKGESLYGPIAQDRHYLTCLQCSQSFPLEHCPVDHLAERLQPSVPFKIYYHTLEFFGLCEACTPTSAAN
jgi:Fur family transcriptional regulator, ferric uptake regulator